MFAFGYQPAEVTSVWEFPAVWEFPVWEFPPYIITFTFTFSSSLATVSLAVASLWEVVVST
jgi:hypothetical protein